MWQPSDIEKGAVGRKGAVTLLSISVTDETRSDGLKFLRELFLFQQGRMLTLSR